MVLHLFQIFKGGPVHIDESSSWRSLKNRPRNLLVDSVAHTLTVVKCWHLHLTLDQFLQLNFSYLFSGVWIQPQRKPYQKLPWEGRGCPGWSQVLWVSCSSPQGELMWHLLSSHAGLALASGLAATVTITHMLKSGDGIICMDDVYGGEEARTAVQRNMMHWMHAGFWWWGGWKAEDLCQSFGVFFPYLQGTNRYFQRVACNLGLEVTLADCTKPEQLKASLRPNTKVS